MRCSLRCDTSWGQSAIEKACPVPDWATGSWEMDPFLLSSTIPHSCSPWPSSADEFDILPVSNILSSTAPTHQKQIQHKFTNDLSLCPPLKMLPSNRVKKSKMCVKLDNLMGFLKQILFGQYPNGGGMNLKRCFPNKTTSIIWLIEYNCISSFCFTSDKRPELRIPTLSLFESWERENVELIMPPHTAFQLTANWGEAAKTIKSSCAWWWERAELRMSGRVVNYSWKIYLHFHRLAI